MTRTWAGMVATGAAVAALLVGAAGAASAAGIVEPPFPNGVEGLPPFPDGASPFPNGVGLSEEG